MRLRFIAAAVLALTGLGLAVPAQSARPAPRKAALPATGPAAPASPAPADPVLVIATPQGSHVIGRASAPVKLVEYVSYTCPHCADFDREGSDPILLMLVRPGKVSFELRPFLRNVIDVAATLMVHCGPPSRFQGNHMAVMRNQEKWLAQPSEAQIQRWNSGDLPTRLRAIASDLNLYPLFETRGYTRPELDHCLANEALIKTIAGENDAAVRGGVDGTPTFLLDGKVQDAHDWASLRPVLEAATR